MFRINIRLMQLPSCINTERAQHLRHFEWSDPNLTHWMKISLWWNSILSPGNCEDAVSQRSNLLALFFFFLQFDSPPLGASTRSRTAFDCRCKQALWAATSASTSCACQTLNSEAVTSNLLVSFSQHEMRQDLSWLETADGPRSSA